MSMLRILQGSPMKKLPSYRLHKASGQAICRILGRTYYLGAYGSEESKREFQVLVAESLTNPHFGIEKKRISVAEGVVSYLKYAESYYSAGTEYVGMRDACKPLIELYPHLHLTDFGIPQYKTCRDFWVKRGCSRQYVNKQAKRLLRLAKWWVAEGLADPSMHQGLKCVEPLKLGRCDCPEAERILPVSDSDVDATIPYLPMILQDAVRLQRLLGCRPGELVSLTRSMVDTQGEVWVIALDHHKTAWRGHTRKIFVGPKGQAILKKYMATSKSNECIFSPKVAVEQRKDIAEANRKTPLSCGNRRGSNRKSNPKKSPGDRYTTQSYGKAIKSACKLAKIEVWSPNQLRHAAATALRESDGIESASLVLGHKSLDVTQVYAEKSEQKAIELAKKHG